MKYSEMNARQKKAFKNICNCANWIIGGNENTLEDYEEKSEEYIEAKALLDDHETLVNLIYSSATTDIYYEGGMMFGKQAEKMIKDIRFCGKEWLMERVERRVIKMGY